MKTLLTKDDVAAAMKELTEQGKKVTLNSMHAALGHRGSMTTLVNLNAEIEGARLRIIDSAEGLKTFREIWALAVHEGRKQQEEISGHLRSDCQALAAENSRLEGVATETEKRANDYLAAKPVRVKPLERLHLQEFAV